MAKDKQHFDIIVIGSGIAGSNSALLAAQAGQKVALVEKNSLGGSSANFRDVPLGVFAEAARIFEEAKQASILGLRAETISYNFPSIKLFKDQSTKNSRVTDPSFYEEKGITVIQGAAQFIRPDTISVDGQHYTADRFIVATGSQWKLPKVPGLAEINYQTPETMINQDRPPRSLFVIGGHQSGIEVASIMASFGTKVFITEISSRLLPGFDEEVGDFMENHLTKNLKMLISTSSRVTSVQSEGNLYRVRFNHAGVEREVKVDQILVATDRQASTDLGLNNAAIKFTTDGIEVNKYFQTSNRKIYAIGAVANTQQTSSESALLESQAVVHNLLRLSKQVVNYDLVPKLVKTNPTIISLGLSEDDCEKRCIEHQVALAVGKEAPYSLVKPGFGGFVKLVANNKRQLIGATIVLDQAENIAQELSVAIQQQLTVQDLVKLPRVFLSASELITIAAEKLL